jgi:hypothetical protein
MHIASGTWASSSATKVRRLDRARFTSVRKSPSDAVNHPTHRLRMPFRSIGRWNTSRRQFGCHFAAPTCQRALVPRGVVQAGDSSLYLPEGVYEALRETAFKERVSISRSVLAFRI